MSATTKVSQPHSIAAVLQTLAADDEALCLSGGATLVAMLNANLVDPTTLVSLKNIPEMSGLKQASDGSVEIGAMTRHAMSAASDLLIGSHAGVREAASKIANPTVRNMGTMGGSVSFADPGADYPPALVAVDAEIEIISGEGSRRIPAVDFFVDWYETTLEPGEIVRAIHLPSADLEATGVHEKFARMEGDFATVSVNVVLAIENDVCRTINIAVGACGPTPVRNKDVEADLIGRPLNEQSLIAAGEKLALECDPMDDMRGSAEYRLKLVPQLVTRATLRARQNLRGAS